MGNDREIPEQVLVREATEGSSAACDALYERHAATAWRVAQAVTHNPDAADDAVAEAFTRVFRLLPSGQLGPDLAFGPYLLAATRNAAIDGLRKVGRLRPSDQVERIEEPSPGPAELVMLEDDQQKMAEAFADLPERWRSVLWMTEVEEIPARDVAKRLSLTPNGAAQLARRARAGLRDRYLQAHVRNHARTGCTYTVEHLGAYIGGGLAARDVATVDQHLAGCTDCTARLAEVKDIGFTLRHIALPLGLGTVALKRFGLRRVLAAATTGGVRRAVGIAAGTGAVVASLGGMASLESRPAPRAALPVVAAPAPERSAVTQTSRAVTTSTTFTTSTTSTTSRASTTSTTSTGGREIPSIEIPPITLPPLPALPLPPVQAKAGVSVRAGGLQVDVQVGTTVPQK